VRAVLASDKVFPFMKGFICSSWGLINGVEGKGSSAVIRDPDVKELFDQMAGSEYKDFVNADQAGHLKGSNATLVVLDARGKLVHVFNKQPFDKGFKEAWEKLKSSPDRFSAKTTYTFPGVKETAPAKGPGVGPAGGDAAYLVKESGPAFRLFTDPGDLVKLVVEARPASPEQRNALAWSSQPREIEACVFKSLLDTINPGGVARAAAVIVPWKEITGSLKFEPAGSDGKFRYAVIRGPIQMTKMEGTFKAEGTFQMAVSYLHDAPEISAVRGAMNVKYVGGGTATAEKPVRFTIAFVMTPEPKEIPEAFMIPFGNDKHASTK